MREVQRLSDRVILHWIQLDEVALQAYVVDQIITRIDADGLIHPVIKGRDAKKAWAGFNAEEKIAYVTAWVTANLTAYNQWIRLPLDSVERNQCVLGYQRVDANPTDINPNDLTSLEQYKPAGVGWHWKGAEGWPGKGLALTFDTPSKNLEPNDIWVGTNEVMWRTDKGEETAPLKDVTITRDSRTSTVITVERKQR